MNLQLALLALYSIGIIVLGLIVSRRVRGASDFLVAGRTLGPGLMFTTFLAANLGAGTTVGAASIGFELGMSAWWWVGSAGIGSLILANLVGPKIWRLAKRYDFQTLGDYLDHRYNRTVRGIIAVLLWAGTLAMSVRYDMPDVNFPRPVNTAVVGHTWWNAALEVEGQSAVVDLRRAQAGTPAQQYAHPCF